MKIAHKSYKLHDIKREEFTVEQLIELFTAPEHLYPGQRDHQSGLKKRKHVIGALWGDSRRFAAVYVKDVRKLYGADGYHRAAAVASEAKLSWFVPGQPPVVDTYVVQTMADAERLFAQFNSLAAAKKSNCWFTSGLRERKVLHLVKSQLVWKRGRATAVQLAAGMVGSAHTKAATMAVTDGLLTVDKLDLVPQKHEVAGTVGAYYAIAQYCSDATLVEAFIRATNQRVFAPAKMTVADVAIDTYRKQNWGSTGGVPNQLAFINGLHAFVTYAYAKKGRKSLLVPVEALNLTVFQQLVSAL